MAGTTESTEEVKSYEQLMLVTQGHVAFHCLKSGLELGLFNLLEDQPELSLAKIMEILGLKETPCKILLRALYSLNLIHKINDKYSNSKIASQYLTKSSPFDYLEVLGWQDQIVYPGIVDLTKSLKENKNIGLKHFPGTENNLYERLSHNPRLEMIFQKSMSALSQSANTEFRRRIDLSKHKTVVDVGGGAGTNLKALIERFPNCHGIIFDLPSVCDIAQKNIIQWKLSDKMSVHSGNLLTDDFPAKVDAFIFCHMFTIWSGEKIVEILKKCHNNLEAGGEVILFNMLSNDNEYGPISCALGSPYFLAIATGEGKLHTLSEYRSWFEQAGFKKVRVERGLPIDHGIIIATKSS